MNESFLCLKSCELLTVPNGDATFIYLADKWITWLFYLKVRVSKNDHYNCTMSKLMVSLTISATCYGNY